MEFFNTFDKSFDFNKIRTRVNMSSNAAGDGVVHQALTTAAPGGTRATTTSSSLTPWKTTEREGGEGEDIEDNGSRRVQLGNEFCNLYFYPVINNFNVRQHEKRQIGVYGWQNNTTAVTHTTTPSVVTVTGFYFNDDDDDDGEYFRFGVNNRVVDGSIFRRRPLDDDEAYRTNIQYTPANGGIPTESDDFGCCPKIVVTLDSIDVELSDDSFHPNKATTTSSSLQQQQPPSSTRDVAASGNNFNAFQNRLQQVMSSSHQNHHQNLLCWYS